MMHKMPHSCEQEKMTKQYVLPPKLKVLMGPNKSICYNCNGPDVEMMFLY